MAENLVVALEVVLPIFLFILVGYGVKQRKLVDDNSINVLNRLAFRVFLPVLLFHNVYNTNLSTAFDGKLMAYAVLGVLFLFLVLCLIIPRIEKDNAKRGVLIQGVFRSNFVVFGLPVTISLFGESAAGTASILVAVVVPLFNVLAVIALELFRGGNKVSVRKILTGIVTNPLIIASALGLIMLSSGLRFPDVLEGFIGDLGGIATPLALILLGASFSFSSVRQRTKQLLLGVIGKLILSPAILLGIGIALGFRGVSLAVLLAVFASPTAVSSYTMAQQMDGDSELAGQLVVFSSVFAVLTIFLWIFFLKYFAFL